jgi:putative acetyltransferase
VNLRHELTRDRESVRDVVTRAFGEEQGAAVANLVEDLRTSVTPGDGLSLVAEHDGEVVGHVMFTRSLLDAPRRLIQVQVLSPLSVAPEHQKRGVGSALVRHGLGILAKAAVPLVFLEGAPAYYHRFGFAPGGDLGFRKPSLRIPDAAYLAINDSIHGDADGAADAGGEDAHFYTLRHLAEIARFFDGTELVEPGLARTRSGGPRRPPRSRCRPTAESASGAPGRRDG